ncbi:RusA family crossover junction endodeoxyribonuclease [Polynucleobacter sp. AP-RePozz3-80-G7]|uniref:RusA family crossover junction endodeoxyribonuclease n=1 Tax=Polynucleobacter sp. AP-RePozz3-80-G7 TaxID=2689105 RepID=UPI001C0CC283|nr:RusA family crossover junction endodeoxyribonuclease [Polynucleobacter sp. AP-RePozz3-80-G7]MBU3640001.1 RusA family crossover junction endodeoxyribonuclease [Polynucleobacter sp. AP-RePozz3-80-G7]
MSKVATLILPLPPTINSYYATVRNRRIVSADGRAFKKYVSDYCLVNRVAKFGSSRILLAMLIHPADKRRSDINNRIKALEDALVEAGVMDDDSQIDKTINERGEIKKGGECAVMLKEIL